MPTVDPRCMDPMDTPPYEPFDAEPTERSLPDESLARTAAANPSSDRTKKVVAIAAVASFFTAMIGMAAARSGDSGSSSTTTTPATTNATTDDGPQLGSQVQPGAAQPAPPSFGRGDTSSRGS
ncbi:MAG: hypothetical protein V7636_2573 [Actinomycetota bacterium]